MLPRLTWWAEGPCPQGPMFPRLGLRLVGLSGTTIKTNKQKQLKLGINR